jgi:hypothetical protein
VGRSKPDKATCPVCGVAITVVAGAIGSHLYDATGQRVRCPGSYTPV